MQEDNHFFHNGGKRYYAAERLRYFKPWGEQENLRNLVLEMAIWVESMGLFHQRIAVEAGDHICYRRRTILGEEAREAYTALCTERYPEKEKFIAGEDFIQEIKRYI